jgi:hypothetical protein
MGADRTQLGRDALTALRHWIELIHVDPGEYGVRGIRGNAWMPFVVDGGGVRHVDGFPPQRRRTRGAVSIWMVAIAAPLLQAAGSAAWA